MQMNNWNFFLYFRTASKKRKLCSDKDMSEAMDRVKKGPTVSAAARMCGVPRRTLDDRIKGRVCHGTNPGPSTEEASLVSYVPYMADRRFPLTRRMVIAFAWAIALRFGKDSRFSEYGPSKKWWSGFKARHPNLTLRKVDNLERCRAEALSVDVINNYFNLLENTLTQNGLLSKPRQVYNCDETFLPLNENKDKVVALKNAKSVYSQSMVTMLCCVSASGSALPPMIIYPVSFPGWQYKLGGPDDTLYANSSSGWIDSERFLHWFKRIFLKFAVPERPLILLVDGHKSHENIELIVLVKIISFCFVCPHIPRMLCNH